MLEERNTAAISPRFQRNGLMLIVKLGLLFAAYFASLAITAELFHG